MTDIALSGRSAAAEPVDTVAVLGRQENWRDHAAAGVWGGTTEEERHLLRKALLGPRTGA